MASLSASESFVLPERSPPPDRDDDVDSLPSTSSGLLSSSSSDAGSSDAQREWEESLQQLQLLLTMVLVPFAGKYLGRKFAYYSWARYMEWMHGVEVRWTSQKTFQVAGAVQAASSL